MYVSVVSSKNCAGHEMKISISISSENEILAVGIKHGGER